MCGIFGVVYRQPNAVPDMTRLEETARLLNHRGPDNAGIFSDAGIGLVHTRLSLLDLNPRSNQPFWDRQGRYCLVYNGEIYNFREIRAELEGEGMEFRTTSDTEVLLECLISRGAEYTLRSVEGMFAFALYDRVEGTLFVARDRFGIKPLFVYDGDDAFAVSSEVRAMRPWVKFEPDILSISSYLFGFGGPTSGHSFFRNIKFLEPGGYVTFRRGRAAEYGRFFDRGDLWDEELAAQLRELKPERLVDMVEERLIESVRMQLFADAPVGTLCSGGLDSSLITAMAAKIHNNVGIFHANVVGPTSEYKEAALVAEHLKIDLNAVEVRPRDFIEHFPEAMDHFGHPFWLMPSSVPFMMVSKLIRENGVKAVLTGEGADECYLGYDILMPEVSRLLGNPRLALRKALERLLSLTENHNNSKVDFKPFLMAFSPYAGLCSRSTSNNGLPELVMGLHNRFEVALETEHIHDRVGKGNKAYMKSMDLLNYNLRALLHRNDALGMTASIESRFPFLDSSLVKFAVNIPHDRKIKFSLSALNNRKHLFMRDKWVLRKVAERYLPRKISWVQKKPFNLGDPYNLVEISPQFFEKSFVVEMFRLTQAETRHLVNRAPRQLKLKIMHLDVWAKVCLGGVPWQAVAESLRDGIRLNNWPSEN